MPIGPGKYDDECTTVRLSTNATAVGVIIIGGNAGNGFSVQGPPTILRHLPHLLRRMANEIEASDE